MNYETYRLIHFAGLFTLFFAFGSLFAGKASTKGAAIGHGIGLLLILLGGFGMQAKRKSKYAPGRFLRFERGDGNRHVRVETMNGGVDICSKRDNKQSE